MIKNILNSIHSKFGKMLISIILGIGLASIFRKSCDNKDCLSFKGPHHNDVTKHIYKHNDDCYTFNARSITCKSKERQVQYE